MAGAGKGACGEQKRRRRKRQTGLLGKHPDDNNQVAVV